MHLSIDRLDADILSVWTGRPLRRLQAPLTARGEHARLLDMAAARRRRSMDRASLNRFEDADYWKAVAPAALERAIGLRVARFYPLP